ncbi:granzyme F-like [Paramacrobiotus metropolitanus]|uniref:granzyme F-like n=1 Tax=Paramacrobiotus metropolitanus TaxID=2943436 RepID=UPI002445B28D|nr:granzyme F-like [Paramacrobiotus metropolitanus]
MTKLQNCFLIVFYFAFFPSAFSIYNGTEAEIHQNPYMAAVLYSNVTGWKNYACAGYIITPWWIVTAAHCCTKCLPPEHGMSWCSILVGAWNLKRNSYPRAHIMKLENVLQHPLYKDPVTIKPNRVYDICLLKTRKEIKFNEDVAPMRFPRQGLGIKYPKKCLVMGWGVTVCYGVVSDENIPENEFSDPLPPNSSDEAYWWLIRTPTAKLHYLGGVEKKNSTYCESRGLRQGQACAIKKDAGPYSGDSGAPLICKAEDDRFYAFATFSKNLCMVEDYPAEYVDNQLAAINNWVRDTVGLNDLNSSYEIAPENEPATSFLKGDKESVEPIYFVVIGTIFLLAVISLLMVKIRRSCSVSINRRQAATRVERMQMLSL